MQATSVIATGTVSDVPDRHTAVWYLALFRRDTCGASDRSIRALPAGLDVEPQADYGGSVKWLEHITIDPAILVGKPVVKGTRIAVELVVDLLGRGYTVEQILQQYDHLTADDVQACLAYAAEVLQSEKVYALRFGVRHAHPGL